MVYKCQDMSARGYLQKALTRVFALLEIFKRPILRESLQKGGELSSFSRGTDQTANLAVGRSCLSIFERHPPGEAQAFTHVIASHGI